MTNRIKFLRYLSKLKRHEFHDVDKILKDLDYIKYSSKYQFLDNLKKSGLINLQESGTPPVYYSTIDKDGNPDIVEVGGVNDLKLLVEIKDEAFDYLDQENQNKNSRLASWWGAHGQWFSGIIALISFTYGLVQHNDLEKAEAIIIQRDSTITSQKITIELLSKSLSASREEMQVLQKKSTNHVMSKK
ncbi:hypothetical protein ACFP1I_22240 [Dyadobacter subterraneus]|uniref:Uncharacterized protein n=1 Tax=Dyadobacter subterraneus TaxID=2773304 RepID=A0ABR9WMW8_9BACT|nr:hypothetical protein [Dyadobacter subterraneus]MBE9465514.1 hypothetical protein [Dyadobacter subterraneus]